ncbi:MAG: glycosyltransferase family protein [Elusimicrobia bacterium]|nr:glycosyltransferase family protein [Elusimicrobiota bacterium]
MRIVAVVQARMSSKRLPGKVLQPIEGKSMIWHVLKRAAAARSVSGVILATSTAGEDRGLRSVARDAGADCFFGDLEDVLDRFYHAAEHAGAEAAVRITGDCPLLDPEIVDACVDLFLKRGADYASNAIERTYPDGLDVEVVSMGALERAWKEAELASEREHVLPYVWKHPELFKLAHLKQAQDQSAMRWTVDSPADLEFVRAIYAELKPKLAFGMHEVLSVLYRRPELAKLNAGAQINEGYQKSLREDRAFRRNP